MYVSRQLILSWAEEVLSLLLTARLPPAMMELTNGCCGNAGSAEAHGGILCAGPESTGEF